MGSLVGVWNLTHRQKHKCRMNFDFLSCHATSLRFWSFSVLKCRMKSRLFVLYATYNTFFRSNVA